MTRTVVSGDQAGGPPRQDRPGQGRPHPGHPQRAACARPAARGQRPRTCRAR